MKAKDIRAGGFLFCGVRQPQPPNRGRASGSPLLGAVLSFLLDRRESAAMAAPAQPKKIVAPTVSQINAEFVTQVRSGESGCVYEGRKTFRPRGLGGGIFLGTGST